MSTPRSTALPPSPANVLAPLSCSQRASPTGAASTAARREGFRFPAHLHRRVFGRADRQHFTPKPRRTTQCALLSRQGKRPTPSVRAWQQHTRLPTLHHQRLDDYGPTVPREADPLVIIRALRGERCRLWRRLCAEGLLRGSSKALTRLAAKGPAARTYKSAATASAQDEVLPRLPLLDELAAHSHGTASTG